MSKSPFALREHLPVSTRRLTERGLAHRFTWPFPARQRVAELDALTVGQEWEVCELQMYRLEGNMIVERWFALGPIKATQLDCELR